MLESESSPSSLTETPPQGIPQEVSLDGPKTVVNPSLQKQFEQGSSIPSNVDSEVIRRLFPSTLPDGDDLPAVGSNGFKLEHFRIEEQIGRGGMGAVFRAVDERLDRIVALKVLAPKLCGDASTVYRFRNEAKSAAKLDHENIARVHYTGIDKGVPFIVFEYVTGTNLRQLIIQRGRLDPAEVVNYALQIASALRHTNAAGVVHRDIKPSNIIITPAGRAKLVDLGLARKEYTESAPELTVAGTTLGTFDYISPEQARDPRTVDVRSDIYSLGCTIYHMLTGETPYPEGTVFKKLLDRQDKAPPNPASRAPGIPPQLAEIVQRMMAGRPHARQSSPEQLINDLMLVASELNLRGVHPEGLVWKPATELSSRRFLERHFVWIIAGVLLFGLAFSLERFTRADTDGDGIAINSPSTDGKNGNGNTGDLSKSPGEGGNGSPKKESVSKPELISRSVLNDIVWNGVAPGAGGLSAVGVAGRFQLTRSMETVPAVSPGVTGSKVAGKKQAGDGKVAGAKKKSSAGATATRSAITILDESGGPSKAYPNLESACAAAQNGQVILLRFNGLRTNSKGEPVVEKPLKIVNKSITIRPVSGFEPVLMFAGAKVASSDPVTRMITVANGTISISNVGFVMNVNDGIEAGNDARWSLFALQKSDRIRLSGVHVSVRNKNERTAAVFEIAERSGPSIKNMKMMKKAAATEVESFFVKLTDCFVRGRCDLFAFPHTRPGQIVADNCAVAIERSLFQFAGGGAGNTAEKTSKIDAKLEHITCLTGRGIADFSVDGMLPGAVLPLSVSARNCLFASRSMQPFVGMIGSPTLRELRQLLSWNGEKNFYDRYAVMWRLQTDDFTMQPQSMSFADWQTHWGRTGDVDPHKGGVVWKRDWTTISAAGTMPADLALDPAADALDNPAATGASDGSAVGADPAMLPKPLAAPKPNAE